MQQDFSSFLDYPQKTLIQLLTSIFQAGKAINLLLRKEGNLFQEKGDVNFFGEKQLAIDLLADDIIQKNLLGTNLVNTIFSEEVKSSIKVDSQAPYFVAYDPLDGSSLMKNNLTIGSIFAIWETNDIINQKGKDLLAVAYMTYGINLNFVITIRGKDALSFSIKNNGEIIPEKIQKLSPQSKNFSFGNFRACAQDPRIKEVLGYFIKSQKTLRYTGCLVADFHKIISDGQGIFLYMASPLQKDKLRLAFECAPLAFLISEQNGLAVNQDGENILDIPIINYFQTTSIIMGSLVEVKNVLAILN